MAYYYPEGYFGPICDNLVSDADIAQRSRPALQVEDPFVETLPELDLDYTDLSNIGFTSLPPLINGKQCKKRILDDGTIEYYDCEWQFLSEIGDPVYPEPFEVLGVNERFTVPTITPDACSPYDPDINIRPTLRFNANGVAVETFKRERSSPVTFKATSLLQQVVDASNLAATFNSNGDLVVTGTGTAVISLDFEWDDNPNTYGQALGSITIGGRTFVQTTGVESGSDGDTISVTAGTYTATIVQGTGYGGFTRKNSNKQLCFKDLDGNDCNARLTITSIVGIDTVTNAGYWSQEGNDYGVWVNPMICTLPREEQTVTYKVDIPETASYTLRFGCDDNAEVFLNDETSPVITAVGGIFAGGVYNTPYEATRSLNAGVLEVTVKCTNSDAGFVQNGQPYGLAYSWDRNPGGWFMKICQGSSCVPVTNIDWVRAGPDGGGDWGDFMNTYAVFPTNYDVDLGTTHSATWNINVPFTGNYELEYGVDDDGTWALDGTQIITSGYQPNSSTYTINNLSAGSHSITCTVVNTGTIEDWVRNPGGIAWVLRIPSSTVTEQQSVTTTVTSNLTATFTSDGSLVIGGTGTGRVQLLFEWDDNPNTYGTALGVIQIAGATFRQTSGQEEGSSDKIVAVSAGTTYPASITGNPSGFTVKDNGNKLCFFDADGNDCNAELKIINIDNNDPVTTTSLQNVQVQIPATTIATSLDLQTGGGGNLIWHTRMATGYEEYTQ